MSLKQPIMLTICMVVMNACSPSLMWQWAPAERLNAKISEDIAKTADAVYLLREHRFLKVSRWQSPSYEQQQVHEVIKILTEKGRESGATNVRVPYPKKGDIVSFEARTIQADGTIVLIKPENIFDDDLQKDEKGDNDWKVRVFAFPKVKVGSVIEYQYTRQVPWVFSYDWSYINAKWPVLKYRLELMGTKDIRYALTAYNTNVKWKQDTEGEYWKISWETENLAASPKGDFRASRKFYDPWWAFRVSQFVKYNYVADRYRSWDTAFRWRADELYFDHEEYYEDWKPTVDIKACKGDVRCAVKRARAFTEKAPLKHCDDDWKGRPLKRIEETGWMSNAQNARAIWKILSEKEIDVRFAQSAKGHWDFWDKDFPAPQELDGQLLYLPKQKGLEEDLWVDPCCPYCKVGEVGSWNRGTDAFVINATKKKFDNRPKVKGAWMKVTGAAAIDELDKEVIQLEVDEEGNAQVSMTETHLGRRALYRKQATFDRSKKKWEEKTRADMTGRIKNAKLGTFDAEYHCEADLSKCSRKSEYSAEALATLDGDDLFVPLSVLNTSWTSYFDIADRKTRIRLSYPLGDLDIVQVQVPNGYRLVEALRPVNIVGPVFQVTMTSEETPQGAKVQRRLRLKPGVYPASSQSEFQKATDAYAHVRNAVLHFTKAPTTP